MKLNNLYDFKKLLTILIVLIFSQNMTNAQELPTRDQIADKYKWQLSNLYASEKDFENDFQKVIQMAEKFTAHQGNFTKSAQNLLNALDDFNNIWKSFSRLMVYASLLVDTDVSNGKNASAATPYPLYHNTCQNDQRAK